MQNLAAHPAWDRLLKIYHNGAECFHWLSLASESSSRSRSLEMGWDWVISETASYLWPRETAAHISENVANMAHGLWNNLKFLRGIPRMLKRNLSTRVCQCCLTERCTGSLLGRDTTLGNTSEPPSTLIWWSFCGEYSFLHTMIFLLVNWQLPMTAQFKMKHSMTGHVAVSL